MTGPQSRALEKSVEWCWTFCLEDNRRLFSRIIEEEEDKEEKEEQEQEELSLIHI